MRQVTIIAALVAAPLFFADPGTFTNTAQAITHATLGPSAEQWSNAANIASQQRALSQQMAKEYFLIASDIEPAPNRKNLAESIARFDAFQKQLRGGDEQANIAPAADRFAQRMDDVEAIWSDLRNILNSAAEGNKPQDSDLANASSLSNQFLNSLENVVKMCERQSGQSPAASLASRQLMLSERMAKEFMLVYLNVNADANRGNTHDSASTFERTLIGFMHGDKELGLQPVQDAETQKSLQALAAHWTSFSAMIAKASEPGSSIRRTDVQAVATASPSFSMMMSQAAGQLARASNASQPVASHPDSSGSDQSAGHINNASPAHK